MKNEFIFPIHIYTDDTDYTGVVYHANYVKYMEHARTEWAKQLGMPLVELAKENIFFVVRSLTIEYLIPARLNDNLEVVSRIEKIGRTSFTFAQDVRFVAPSEKILTRGQVTLVCIDSNLKPRALPKTLIEGFTNDH